MLSTLYCLSTSARRRSRRTRISSSLLRSASIAFWKSTADGVGWSQPARSDAARLATRLFANQKHSSITSASLDDRTRADTASDNAINSAK